MSGQQPEQEKKVTSKGAVEIDEEKLDQAAGGAATEINGLNFAKLEVDYARKAGGEPQLSPEKEI